MEEAKMMRVHLSDIADYLQEHDNLKKYYLENSGINNIDMQE